VILTTSSSEAAIGPVGGAPSQACPGLRPRGLTGSRGRLPSRLGTTAKRPRAGLHAATGAPILPRVVDGFRLRVAQLAKGQKYVYKGGPERKTYSDPDASWGHRSAVSTRAAGSFYGYKLHQAVDATTGLPLAWRVETARDAESTYAVPLLESVRKRGFRPEVAVMDMGYDLGPVYEGFEQRGCHPIIPLRETPPSRLASTARPSASMASGRLRGRCQAAGVQVALPHG
jgi:IS5 family transposase